jgi:hypothetical protein
VVSGVSQPFEFVVGERWCGAIRRAMKAEDHLQQRMGKLNAAKP